jgi:precorrin-2 dehydrogenase/sirohydrochlorin ferrochelatase
MQSEVRAVLPDAAARRRFLRAALSGPAAEAALAGDMAGAKARLRTALADAPDGMTGLVQYVDARGPADLLTLRAVRALAAADILVCDPDVHPDVLALARRDAERRDGFAVADLTELALQGLRVARLITGAGWHTEQAALEAAGVATEVLPIAS